MTIALMTEPATTLRDEYINAALFMRFGMDGTYWVATPLGGKQDAWSFMRIVSRHACSDAEPPWCRNRNWRR